MSFYYVQEPGAIMQDMDAMWQVTDKQPNNIPGYAVMLTTTAATKSAVALVETCSHVLLCYERKFAHVRGVIIKL